MNRTEIAPGRNNADTALERILEIRHVSGNVKLLPIDQISLNPDQPRREIDQGQLESLVRSIRRHGLLHPVSVTEIDRGYQLICGERRYRAAVILQMPRIPAIVLPPAPEAEKKRISIQENFQRQDLNIIDKSRVLSELATAEDINTVSEDLGVSRRTVERYVMIHRNLYVLPELYDLAKKWANSMDIRSAMELSRMALQLKDMKALSETVYSDLITAVKNSSLSEALRVLRKALRPKHASPQRWSVKRTAGEVVITLRLLAMQDEEIKRLQTQIEQLIYSKEVSS